MMGVSLERGVAAGGYDWLPPDAESAESRATETYSKVVVLPVLETTLPKATADPSRFSREYVIDLVKYGISDKGEDAANTSKGLNAALQDAKAAGANRIVFPKGIYLISETEPIIFDHQDIIVDLNGSTLRINPNGLPDYSMIEITDAAHNFRLTNGTLQGDRDAHDYKSIKAPHEQCRLLRISGGRELEIDHLLICDAPGFAVTTSAVGGVRNRPGLLAMIFHEVKIKDLESGSFDENGRKIDDPLRTRTSKPYDVSKCGGQFEFGWTGGYMGFPYIKDRNYQTVFFDKDMKFLQKNSSIQYKKIPVPEGANFVHLEFNQPEVLSATEHPGAGAGDHCGRITNFRTPSDVHFHNNKLVNNRALGLAFTGGVRWVIENNHFEKNGGQAPSFGVDFEDGWELMQNIVFRKNIFSGNANDLVVCAGTELLFEENTFEKNVVIYGRTFNYTFRKNRVLGGRVSFSTRSGVLNIHNNRYENLALLTLSFDGKGIADGFFHQPNQSVSTPPIELKEESLVNVEKVTGTYLNFVDSKIKDTQLVADKETVLVSLHGCTLENTSIVFDKAGPKVSFSASGNKGILNELGPGVSRKVTVENQGSVISDRRNE